MLLHHTSTEVRYRHGHAKRKWYPAGKQLLEGEVRALCSQRRL